MSHKDRRLSLAYQDLEVIPENTVQKYGETLEELDLAYNHISDFRFLTRFPNLTTLILDHNQIESHVKFPFLPNLHTLWLNQNDIMNLSVILKTLSSSFPNLRYLSMMKNQAAPSYFNGGTLLQYTDYRQYVTSQLTNLNALDDQPITSEDRREAERIYKKPVVMETDRKAQRRSSKDDQMVKSQRRSSTPKDGATKSKSKKKKKKKKLFDD